MNALIGYTGFVGSNISKQAIFDKEYNSKNIGDIAGNNFNLVVCAGVSSVKWKANKDPEHDFREIQNLINNLEKATFKKLVLISTIAVYDNPADNAYGKNRLYLETYLSNKHKDVTIVRLPSLFGSGIKKNPIFDLLNNDYRFLPHWNSEFQYYFLGNIWKDIQIAIDNDLKLLNINSEPIQFSEVLKMFGVDFSLCKASKITKEDMKTQYATYWNKSGDYLYSKEEIIRELERFIQSYGRVL